MLIIVNYVYSAKMLGIFPMAHGSHYILNWKLMKALADAGHNVTIVSPNIHDNLPKTKGSINEIILDGYKEDIAEMMHNLNFFETGKQNVILWALSMIDLMVQNTNKTFYHPKIKKLFESKEKFDLVVIEQFQDDPLKIVGKLFDCPLVLLYAVGPNNWINPTIGNPEEISYIRHFHFIGDPAEPMTLLERTKNLLLYITDNSLKYLVMFPRFDEVLQQRFTNPPKIKELYTNASLVLLNSHTSIYPPQPLVPSMIEIGGYHVDPPQKLPKDLQEFVDSATDGVIYFSMGSQLKSKDMHEDRKNIILNVLRKLKQKVIWKFEEDLPGRPDNVLIRKWLPQQDILAHPNIKLFITHGGLLSIIETIYHGVPVLAIPVFADQPLNAERVQYGGYGLQVSYHGKNFNEETLTNLIQELLNNPKYRNNAQSRSRLFHDRPLKPVDNAIYWIEYVIRNNGARHLKVGRITQPWYQYLMLDVVLLLTASILLFIIAVKYIFVTTLKRCSRKRTVKVKCN